MKRKKGNNKKIYYIIGAVTLIVIIIYSIYASKDYGELKDSLEKDGYGTIDNNDAFYKKVVSERNIDEYYEDVTNGIDTKYEEYTISKESYDFVELKMEYKDEVNTIFSINSNLKGTTVKYNFELSYGTSHILIEGGSNNKYSCDIIDQQNASDETVQYYCNQISDEVKNYLNKRTAVLNNPKLNEVLNQPINEVVETERPGN